MEQEQVKRRRFDKQFKVEAVRLVTEGGRRTTEVARDLGISVNSIYHWKCQLSKDGKSAFPGKGHLKPEDEELRRLRKELADVKEERDILKKAIAYFTKHGT
jgi:transposase